MNILGMKYLMIQLSSDKKQLTWWIVIYWLLYWDPRYDKMELVKHVGGCHCGAIRFEVWNSPDLHVFNCNCSICTKKQNHHFIVPGKYFKLLQGSDNLTTYTFNTHIAKHTFCKTCGVQSFYTPRSNPDGYGISPQCLEPGTVRSVTVEEFGGDNWEESMKAHKSIKNMSVAAADI
ncbi:centromere protein V isoform X1 [Takifugu rubripes]|uniref:centromere protein V isoform X1 n=1 Tax=Takifugu rubripes TaxID=31033 RepID=UPI001145B4C1|nr:centromere protein V isoform X1 [Takifugu rubripes]